MKHLTTNLNFLIQKRNKNQKHQIVGFADQQKKKSKFNVSTLLIIFLKRIKFCV